MQESRYLKIDYEEAVEDKKQILNLEIDLLNLHQAVVGYKDLRKRELETKNKIRNLMRPIRARINFIESNFPEEYKEIAAKRKVVQEKHVIEKIEKEKSKEKPSSKFQSELEDIKEKLSRLG